jgi:hypothetical protein
MILLTFPFFLPPNHLELLSGRKIIILLFLSACYHLVAHPVGVSKVDKSQGMIQYWQECLAKHNYSDSQEW